MPNIYKINPRYQNKDFLIRKIQKKDANDLLEVYSDINSVPLFNSDNCQHDFYITNIDRMNSELKFWRESYNNGWFARLGIIDRANEKMIGTLEVFLRKAFDSFDNCVVLRIDLKSEYEKEEYLDSILDLFIPKIYDLFGNKKIITKGFPKGKERINSLVKYGFTLSKRKLIGTEDNKEYDNYYVYNK